MSEESSTRKRGNERVGELPGFAYERFSARLTAASCVGDESIQTTVEREVMIRRQLGEARSASSVRAYSLFVSPLDDSGGGDFFLPSDSILLAGLPVRARSPCLLMSRP